jgi:S1-C subfamily serine protease
MRDGRVRRARLGLAGQTTPLDARLARRLHREGETAVLISEIVAGGPAERAGLRAGDVVLEFAGATIFTVDDLHRLLTAEIAGGEAEITLIRQAKIETLVVQPDLDD